MVKTQPSSTKALFSFLWGFRSFVKYEVFLKWRSRTSKKGGVMLLLLLSALVLLSGCAEKVRTENLYENEEIIECTNLKNMLYRLIGRGHHLSDLPGTFQVC